MNLIFNELGILTETQIEPIRKGDTQHKLTARFLGKDNDNYIARFSFTRPNGSRINNVLMDNSAVATDFEKALNDNFYFAIAGNATLTVALFNSKGEQIANGQVVLHIERTDIEADTTITYNEYEDILTRLASVLKNEDTILVVDALPTETNLIPENQHYYHRVENKFYVFKNGVFAEVLAGQHKLAYFAFNAEQLAKIEQKAENGSFVIYQVNGHFTTGYIVNHSFEMANNLLAAYDSVGDAFSSDKYAKRDANGRLVVADPAEDYHATTKGYVDAQIARYGSHKLTKNAEGDNFDTFEELEATTVFYYKGVEHEPDENDFVIVNNYQNKPAKFSYDGLNWTFDFYMTELTEEQQEALNSGITAEKVEFYDDKIGQFDEELATIETELAEKSSVSVSTSEVAGRPTIKSINVDGFDYNLGGSGGGEYTAGTGIKIEDDTISVDDTIATKSEVEEVRKIAEGKTNSFIIDTSIEGNEIFETKARTITAVSFVLNGETILISSLKKGDVIYTIDTLEEHYPDWFVVNPETGLLGLSNGDQPDLTNVAKTNKENTFTENQTIDAGKRLLFNSQNVANPNAIQIANYSGSLYFYNSIGTNIGRLEQGGNLGIYNCIYPITASGDLGRTNNKYRDAYLSGDLYLGNFDLHTVSANEIQLRKNASPFLRIQNNLIMPYTTNVLDIGNSTHKIKDLYLSGNISDGTNSVSVADIETKEKQTSSIETSYSGSLLSKNDYSFTNPLTSISIVSFEGDGYWKLRFTAGDNFSLTFTPTVKWAYGTPTFEKDGEYTIIIEKSITANTYVAYLVLGA